MAEGHEPNENQLLEQKNENQTTENQSNVTAEKDHQSPQTQSNVTAEKYPEKHEHMSSDRHARDPLRMLCTFITIFLLLAGIAVLVVWLIYRPHKPQFTVVAAAIYDLNATSPPFISTSLQFTLVTRNPNKRVSIIYDKLSAYVSYRSHPITPTVVLPPLYHDKKTTVSLSPVLGGAQVPVSAEVVNGLVVDESYGVVALRVVLLGRLRWKAGAIKTGRYGVHVKCDVWVGLKKGLVGQVPLLGSPQCKVDI